MAEPSRRFLRSADEIRPLAPGYGWCMATDHILVEGRRVGWMYREEPINPVDSGWRFFSGTESEEYLDSADNVGGYDVNTVANYDPGIIPLLDAPIGSAFERDDTPARGFVAVVPPGENPLFPVEAGAEGLNPRYPAVTGTQPLPDGWSLGLPRLFSRRHEDDRLVFWRPGLTLWVGLSRSGNGRSPDENLDRMKEIVPPHAFALEELRGRDVAHLAYRLRDDHRKGDEVRPVHAFYGFAFSAHGYADLEIFADDENDIAIAREIWLSMTHVDATGSRVARITDSP